jgi:signal peptide peptidase SppA
MNAEKLNWLARHGDIWALWRERAAVLFAESAEEEMRKPSMPKVSGTVAIMPLTGVMTQRGDWWGTSTEAFGRAFSAALASDNIAGIVIDIDSPGGSVYGTSVLADKVFEARGKKPVVAIANSMAASAAYWVGSAAEKFVVAPAGDVGSIGVWSAHEDWSKYLEEMGIKTTLVSAGRYKTEGHPYGPLDEDARGEMQRRVDAFYDDFIQAVARNRGVRVPAVRNGFGLGRVVNAREAEAEGMVDGIMSLDEVLRGMIGTIRKPASKSSAQSAEQELHAAYMGAIELVAAAESSPDEAENEETVKSRQEREARVASLRASEREDRLKEMEAV